MIYKLLYLILFCSIDILLYLRLSKNIIKAGYWLIFAGLSWLVILVIHLPIFHLTVLMPLKGFVTLSAMVVQLLIVYYVGLYSIKRVERSNLNDDLKQYSFKAQSFVFKTLIFAIFFATHMLFICRGPVKSRIFESGLKPILKGAII